MALVPVHDGVKPQERTRVVLDGCCSRGERMMEDVNVALPPRASSEICWKCDQRQAEGSDMEDIR
jgi:hypothetical protein